MIRAIVISMCAFVSVAPAQATRPGLIGATPATQPSFEELHAQAVELMRAKQLAQAGALLDVLAKDIPPQKRSRPLVLNRAIVDLMQGKFVVRGLKELSEYLIKHREEDEFATNVLGAMLNVAAGDLNVKRGPIWQAAYKEWERRDYVLNRSRPGWHRWGTKWLSEEEYAGLQGRMKERDDAIAAQEERLDRAAWRVGAKRQQVESDEAYATFTQNMQFNDVDPNRQYVLDTSKMLAQSEANAQVKRSQAELRGAMAEVAAERAALMRLRAQVIRPQWPTAFEPVNPSELSPPPPPPMPVIEKPPVDPAVPFNNPLR